MGLNISVIRVIGENEENKAAFVELEHNGVVWQSWAKHNSDVEFVDFLLGETEKFPGAALFRPRDFRYARGWAQGSGMPSVCKSRLLTAFDRMQDDPKLWFSFSY